MAACTQQAYHAMLADSWTRVEERESGMPRHNWAQTGFSNRWDAAKYCGDYADGFQHGYATAVCYTIRMPADALAGTAANIVSLAIPVYGDRWLADGCDIGVTLSASATPPAWDAPADDAVTGQLAVTPSNTGTDTSATVVFDWSAAPKTALAYLHITLRLTDYLTHRGAWIEGSAMINGAGIAVTFDRDVEPDDAADPADAIGNLVVPIRLYAATANRVPVTYTGANGNLESTHLRRHWTADMLRAGQGAAATADDVAALCPMLTASGLQMTATGHIVKAWCPVADVAGSTLWLRAIGSSWPTKSTIRVSIFTGADMPAVDAAATWSGTGSTCIGTALFSGVAAGDVLGVPLTAAASSPIWLVCAFEQVSVEDSAFGAPDTGFSLVDAHVATLPVSTDAIPHFVTLGIPAGTPIGLIRDAAGDPSALMYCYGVHRDAYVGRKMASYTWLNPGDVSGEWRQVSVTAAGSDNSNYIVAVGFYDGVLRLATNGTLPASLLALEGVSGYAGAVALPGTCLATLDNNGVVAAVAGGYGTPLATAINTAAVTDGSEIRGYGKCLLIRSGPTVQAVGTDLNGTFVANVAALTGVSTLTGFCHMAIGNTWACFIKDDYTVATIALADGSADATVAGWTDVQAIATAHNAIVAVNTSGKLLVANGAAYAGLDSASIAALNARYVFYPSIIANVGAYGPEFAVAVMGLAPTS
jgi:hypothetical protein